MCTNNIHKVPESNNLESAKKTTQKRAARKSLSCAVGVALAERSKITGSPLQKSYRNTWYCSGAYVWDSVNKTYKTTYCGNRWCTVCGAIHSAKATNKYAEILASFEDLQFVTLTIPNVECDVETLKKAFADMLLTWQAIVKRFRRNGVKLKGLRKLECTVSAKLGNLHPHYHIVVDGAENAQLIRAYWVELWAQRGVKCDFKGQDVRPADTGSVKELFKYFTKLITSKSDIIGTPADDVYLDGRGLANIDKLDIIFQAMRRKMIWRHFGFKVENPEEVETVAELESVPEVRHLVKSSSIDTGSVWVWEQAARDWLEYREETAAGGALVSTGVVLSDYNPKDQLEQLIQYIEQNYTFMPDAPGQIEAVRNQIKFRERSYLKSFIKEYAADNVEDANQIMTTVSSMSQQTYIKLIDEVLEHHNFKEKLNPEPESEIVPKIIPDQPIIDGWDNLSKEEKMLNLWFLSKESI